MTVYIDKDYKCHGEPASGLRAFEVAALDGKCKRFVEGYRYVPAGETWMREDGAVFAGEMIAPAEDYSTLVAAQAQYEESLQTINKYEAALTAIEEALGV